MECSACCVGQGCLFSTVVYFPQLVNFDVGALTDLVDRLWWPCGPVMCCVELCWFGLIDPVLIWKPLVGDSATPCQSRGWAFQMQSQHFPCVTQP